MSAVRGSSRAKEVEIVVVGGGPAGAAVAAYLSAAGREVLLLERRPSVGWRACGVYTSPMTRQALLDVGLAPAEVARLIRPIRELRVETLGGASCRIAHDACGPAAGVDRPELERALLGHARRSGARLEEGTAVRSVAISSGRVRLDVLRADGPASIDARMIVGADGPRSLVARSMGVRANRLPIRRAGLTLHRADPAAAPSGEEMTARLVFGRGWYLGVTPVPGGRVNVGLVVGRDRLEGDPARIMDAAIGAVPAAPDDAWRSGPVTDGLRVAYPLAHRVRRLAGDRSVLVGDACGFIDPVTGEGLHRALRSAELGAGAILAAQAGGSGALASYDRNLRAEYRRKDAISYLFQLFMSRPEVLDYAVRRLARRESVRSVFGMVMSDLLPPDRVFDPRFVAAFLAP